MTIVKIRFSKFLSILVVLGLMFSSLSNSQSSVAYAKREASTALTTLSFEAATYRDETLGFEFDYPAAWTVSDPVLLENGDTLVQFAAPDGTIMTFIVHLWQPVNDLNAYVEHRMETWSVSTMTILSQDPMTLAGDRSGVRFMIQTAASEQTFFFFTSFGDRYLELNGLGDPALLAEIALTVRPTVTPTETPPDTAVPPVDTVVPPTDTPVPPTNTAVPPTNTAALAPQGGIGGGVPGEQDGNGVSAQLVAGSLSYFYKWTINGGYVAAGTGMRNLGKGKITINGIPAGSTVKAAYLYWNIISTSDTAANKAGKLNGTSITGTLIGTTTSPCWGNGSSRSYRANVTSLVNTTSPRVYELTGFASGRTDGADPWSSATAPLLEGASLVIVYNQSRYPSTTILLYNGAVRTSSSVGYAETTMTSFPAYSSYLAYTTFIVADGQIASINDDSGSFNGTVFSAADLDGTDPKWTGGSYSKGNLWDTESASTSNTAKRGLSVGKYIPASATSAKVRVTGNTDCLVHVAQVLSVSNGQSDTDGDGLRDSWEANGYSTVNLPALGANPFHKDVYMEIDYMGTIHKPSTTVVNGMVAAFAGGNVVNPDRKTGVALHVDVSNSITHRTEFTSTSGCGDLFTKLETTKTANMVAARYPIYHYQLWVHDLCPDLGSTSGYAQAIPGDDSFVSLGSWGASEGTTNERIGTGLHELGHTLNLRHGFPTGVSISAGDANDPWTPNHLSVMSYIYQTSGLIKNGAYGLFDYQRWNLGALNETCLNETTGVGGGSALDLYGLRWFTYNRVNHQNLTAGSANGPIDWNSNGSSATTCLSFSINNDTAKGTLQATKAEWPLIVYNGGAVGFGAEFGLDANGEQIPVFYIDPLTFKELTFEEAQLMNGK